MKRKKYAFEKRRTTNRQTKLKKYSKSTCTQLNKNTRKEWSVITSVSLLFHCPFGPVGPLPFSDPNWSWLMFIVRASHLRLKQPKWIGRERNRRRRRSKRKKQPKMYSTDCQWVWPNPNGSVSISVELIFWDLCYTSRELVPSQMIPVRWFFCFYFFHVYLMWLAFDQVTCDDEMKTNHL